MNLTARWSSALRLCVLGCTCLAMFGVLAATSSAYYEQYGGATASSGVKQYASGTHTWNYNRSQASAWSADNCAYISVQSNGNNAIYGSGCVAGSDYSFCHAPVVNLYYAFIEHLNDLYSLTQYGYAETGKNCSAGFARSSPMASFAQAPSDMQAFTRPTNAGDQLPEAMSGLIATENAAPNSATVDASAARRVGPDSLVFALPAKDGLCAGLVIPDGDAASLACTDKSHGNAITATTVTPGGYTAWGVVADSAKAVDVTLGSGDHVWVPVKDNGYSQTFAASPRRVTVIG